MSRKYMKIANLDILLDKRKNVKYLYIKVFAIDASVRVIAPKYCSDKRIKDFVLEKLEEINKSLEVYRKSTDYKSYEYVSGEKHLLWGGEYSLEFVRGDKNGAYLSDKSIVICTVKEESADKRKLLLNKFYREELIRQAEPLFEKNLKAMNTEISEFRIKDMKTRWGTCNIKDRRIWLNLQLAKKPLLCLDYVIVHELSHLFERNHNKNFYKILDNYFPDRKEAEYLLKIKKQGR